LTEKNLVNPTSISNQAAAD